MQICTIRGDSYGEPSPGRTYADLVLIDGGVVQDLRRKLLATISFQNLAGRLGAFRGSDLEHREMHPDRHPSHISLSEPTGLDVN